MMTARGWFPAALAGLLLLVGCASDPMPQLRADYMAGRYQEVAETLRGLVDRGGDDSHLYGLELGVAAQAAEQPALAVDAMRHARDRMDELHGRGVWESVVAMLADDRSLDYEGYDYEHVLVRAMLAVADLMHGGKDAFAYAFQVLDRQQKIIEAAKEGRGGNLKQSYKLVAFGSYLRAIINEEQIRDRAVAEVEYRKVKELAPQFRFADRDLARAKAGTFAKAGHGVVHVLGLVGRGPFRVQTYQPAGQELLGIAQFIWNIHRNRPVLPNMQPLPVPALAFHVDNPTELLVEVGGRDMGSTAVLTDVEEMARAEFPATRRDVMVRGLLRRMLKLSIAEGTKEAVYRGRRDDGGRGDSGRAIASLGIDLLTMIWTASEKADLRCWSLLPATFQVLRLELPEGEHDLVFRAGVGGRATGAPQRVRARVDAGFNTYVSVITPSAAGGAPPATSAPGREASVRPAAGTATNPTGEPQ